MQPSSIALRGVNLCYKAAGSIRIPGRIHIHTKPTKCLNVFFYCDTSFRNREEKIKQCMELSSHQCARARVRA